MSGTGTIGTPLSGQDAARRALRHVASGVTVLTVNRAGVRHGTTVSAVVTVSRTPLILGACLRQSSTFTKAVREVGRFSVNVLGLEQDRIAKYFASPDRPAGVAQFAGLGWTTDPVTDAPLLADCVAHLACEVIDCRKVGDHDLLLAEVLAGTPGSGVPLLHFAGRLQLGGVPTTHE